MENSTRQNHPQNSKYFFKKALRPFSFPVALITCLIGIIMAHKTGNVELSSTVLIILAGLLLQAGVNLINDHADLKNHLTASHLSSKDKTRISFNYRIGWACFLACSLVGLYLVSQTSVFLLLIATVGGLGALFYTTEPVNYKRRGLGVILVFFFMGVLMVYGSFYAAIGQHCAQVIYASLPISCLTSALLLSNELRDYDADKGQEINTLTVRVGFINGNRLYRTMILLAFITALPLVVSTTSALHAAVFIPAMLLAIDAISSVSSTAHNNRDLSFLPPKTGRLYLVFGMGQITLLLLTL